MAIPLGGNEPPLDMAAQSVIAGAQRLLDSRGPRSPMTLAEKAEAREAIEKNGALCLFCAGIHVGASTPACPRLASGKLNGDGTVVEFTYWGSWDATRVVFPEDIEEDEDKESDDG